MFFFFSSDATDSNALNNNNLHPSDAGTVILLTYALVCVGITSSVGLILMIDKIFHFSQDNTNENDNMAHVDTFKNNSELENIGLTEDNLKNDPELGAFFDPVKLQIMDNPVVLNTGDIVDKTTAEELISKGSKMPSGIALNFYRSIPLKNLLDQLVQNKLESQQNSNTM